MIARESNARDLPLLEGMIVQTHERYDLPGRQRLMQLGVRPVTHPDEVGAEQLRRHGTRAVLFSIDGTACLYSQGSAAKDENLKRENGFVELLCEVIDRHKPKNVYVATFSRLVRSFYHASPVHRALENARSTLHYSEGQPINFALSGAALHWSVMSAFADMERKAIVTRLMLGRIGKHRQGKWIQGPAGIPMGYALDGERRLVVDTRRGVAQAVHKAIRLMGDPEVGMREIGTALGAIGVLPPKRASGSRWDYDPEWSWNGSAYVPRGRRPPDDDTHVLYANVGRTRRNPRNVAEYAFPELVAKRLIASLDLWQSGELTITYGNPIHGTTRFAEYPTVTGEDGRSRVEFRYAPGVPDGGWATEEEFARARAVRTEAAERETSRAVTRNQQMPLLGNLGRWQDDDYRYALLTSHSTLTRRYELQRLPIADYTDAATDSDLVDELDAETTAGTEVQEDVQDTDDDHDSRPRVFARHGLKFGERLAKIDASDLHHAIANAVIAALDAGVATEPHPRYPPSRIDPVGTARVDDLRGQLAAAESKVASATTILLDELNSHVRQHLTATLERSLTEEQRLRTELDQALTRPNVAIPTDLVAHPVELASALAVLRGLQRPTPRLITEAVNTIFTELRLIPDGATVRGTIKVNLPVEDGILVLGPIAFDVPQRMGSRTTGTVSIDTETSDVRDSRYRDIVEQLLTTNLPIGEIADSRSLSGQTDRQRAIDWMRRNGMTTKGATRALECAPLAGRATIWQLLTSEPAPNGIDPAYVERMRHAYFVDDSGAHVWWRPTGLRADLTAFVRDNGGPVSIERLKQWLNDNGSAAKRYRTIFQPPNNEKDGPLGTQMLATVVVPWKIDRTFCDDTCNSRCWEHRPVSLRPCPHCDGLLDHHVPVIEVPTGLLCGACRREPTDDSPVFPAEYLTVTAELAEQRADDLKPHRKEKRTFKDGTRAIRDNARAWALETGRPLPKDRTVNTNVIDAYLDAVGRDEVQDTMVIRQWARENGIAVNTRGKLADKVVTAYRQHLAETYPRIARQWARAHGYRVPRTGDLDPQIVQAFAKYRAT